MFCPQCGKALPDSVSFCSGCGKAIRNNPPSLAPSGSTVTTTTAPNQPILTVRPTFCLLPVMLRSILPGFIFALLSFFLLLFLTDKGENEMSSRCAVPPSVTATVPADDACRASVIARVHFSSSSSDSSHEYHGPIGAVLVTCLIIWLVGSVISFFVIRGAYENMVYRFYPDRMEYIDGYFTRNKKMIRYRHVTEVDLTQNVLQRMYNVGSITLSTPSGAAAESGATGGISMPDVSNADRTYDRIRALVEQAR